MTRKSSKKRKPNGRHRKEKRGARLRPLRMTREDSITYERLEHDIAQDGVLRVSR